MTWFQIAPQDVWFFRDGRPFNAEEDNSAQSMFPPTPMTVQGALRQKISQSHGVTYYQYRKEKTKAAETVGKLIGTFEAQKEALDTGAFRMRGPFVSVQHANNPVMPLFPCPADLLVKTDKETDNYDDAFISVPKLTVVSSDLDTEDSANPYQFLEVEEGYENLQGHWMSGQAFTKYLDNQAPDPAEFVQPVHAKRASDAAPRPKSALDALFPSGDVTPKHIFPHQLVYQEEGRFGVATDSATSFREEGMLYQAQYIRPSKGVGLLVDVDGEHSDKHMMGQITIGGEQRQATVTPVEIDNFPTIPQQISGTFKIVFLTPAYFANGWLPAKSWSELFGTNAMIRLVGAGLYRPVRIGGWNSAVKGQRAMHRYVSPGSVYTFEITNGTLESPPPAVTETPPRMSNAAQIGFGQVAYSVLNNSQS